MRSRHGVVLLVAMVAMVAMVALAACDKDAAPPPDSAGTAAPSDTATKIQSQLEQQKTFAFETVSLSVDDAGKPVLGELHSKGLVQKAPAASTLETSLQANGETLGDSQALTFVNGKAYARAAGQAWAEIADNDETWADGMAQRDPSVVLVMLAASKDLKQIGQQTINGVATTGYAGTFTADQFDQLPIANKAVLAGLKNLYAPTDASKTMTVEAWVDAAMLAQRLVVRWKSDKTANSPAMTTTVTSDLSNFNAPVDIKPPI
jgi:hypothetical protein